MKRYSDEERQWVLEEFRASGLSLAAFCRREGLCYATVGAWHRRERFGDNAEGTGTVTLVELRSDSESTKEAGTEAVIDVVLADGTRVCFSGGIDVSELARFCRELQR